jgi:hypothetical protein
MLKRIDRKRKLALGATMAVVLGGGLYLSTGISQAGESCAGLDTALRNNLNFIADQQRNPDSQSAARIANRQAVVDLIQQRRRVAGCTANVVANRPGVANQPAPAKTTAAAPPPANQGNAGGAGQRVCTGQNVTFFNEDAGPAASSGQFPIGTRLRVTNLDNNNTITVTVTSPSASCILLNNAAMDRVRQPGKNVIRNVVVERL